MEGRTTVRYGAIDSYDRARLACAVVCMIADQIFLGTLTAFPGYWIEAYRIHEAAWWFEWWEAGYLWYILTHFADYCDLDFDVYFAGGYVYLD